MQSREGTSGLGPSQLHTSLEFGVFNFFLFCLLLIRRGRRRTAPLAALAPAAALAATLTRALSRALAALRPLAADLPALAARRSHGTRRHQFLAIQLAVAVLVELPQRGGRHGPQPHATRGSDGNPAPKRSRRRRRYGNGPSPASRPEPLRAAAGKSEGRNEGRNEGMQGVAFMQRDSRPLRRNPNQRPQQ